MYRIALSTLALSPAWPASAAEDPDALYAQRADLTKAVRSAELWQSARDAAYQSAMAAARKAIAARPARAEGHFWLAACMGGYAQDHGIRGGLKYRGDIRDELEKVLAIDKAFQQGSADRALGRWYFQVPGLLGGSKRKSEEHLRAALAYNPRSIVTRLFLAETLEALDRRADAVAELRQIEQLTPDPEWIPEDTEFKVQARAMLARLTGSK